MAQEFSSLVERGRVHRRVYTDPAVFAEEQRRIFRRAWLYVAHESEVPRPGDYVLTRLGPEEVILVRRDDGALSLLHNRCAHRGARIVSEPSGNLRQLRCPYHSWTYRLDGSLLGVPLAEGYADDARLPDTWNKKTNVKWAADVPGWGLSCPVVWGDKVFVTTVVSDGEQAAPKKGLYLGQGVRTPAKGVHHWLVYCFDLKSGKEVWKHEAHAGEPKVPRHPKSGYAAETPAT